MLKKIIAVLVLFPAIAFAGQQTYTQVNTVVKEFINDGMFKCDFFPIDKITGLANTDRHDKKGSALIHVENVGASKLRVTAELSDTVLISIPLLQLEQGKDKFSSYGYREGDNVYQLASAPETGLMMVINSRSNNIEVNTLIMNCSTKNAK